MHYRTLLLLALLPLTLVAGNVVRVNGSLVAVEFRGAKYWRLNDTVCIREQCGPIVAKREETAIVKLESVSDALTGTPAYIDRTKSAERVATLAPTTESLDRFEAFYEKREGATTALSLGSGVPFDISSSSSFPLSVNFQYRIERDIAIGLSGYMKSIQSSQKTGNEPTIKQSLTGVGLNLNYYSSGPFNGFWLRLEVGGYSGTMTYKGQSESQGGTSLGCLLGYRLLQDGFILGAGVNIEYYMLGTNDALNVSYSGLQPSAHIDLGFAF